LGAKDGDNLEEEFLANEAAGDIFALFWEAIAEPEIEAFSCFWEWNSRASFSVCFVW